ncbi:MAG: hypothetical protein JNL12_11595 [Planctomycetes bacterium]|nr:hypothetical protein [Planctomycetota bacterium]
MSRALGSAAGRSSWPWLLGAAVLFLGGFAAIRQRSTFLQVESRAARAAELALAHGVERAAVLALHESLGAELDDAAWAKVVADYAVQRVRLGPELAALWVLGDEPARAAVATAHREAGSAAWQRLSTAPLALPAHRFVTVRERFAARSAARD